VDRIEIVIGDITTLRVDAIVNAANRSLAGGGGVDGAIHRAAGPELVKASRALAPCPTGDARITPGFRLPATWVIHTVGPVWQGGRRDEPHLLASCYRRSLMLAREHEIRTIAFPSISTGIYGYPVELAAPVALREIRSFLEQHVLPEKVTVVCFDNRTHRTYREVAEAV
jgi:O-acetyl-ADP-ribose deacetylase